MSPAKLKYIQLPPNAPRRLRANVHFIRFLEHHNRLDGIMAFFAVFWSLVVLVADDRLGIPAIILLLAGSCSYVARTRHALQTRSVCALASMGTWAALAVTTAHADPGGATCYTALALAKFFSYTYFVLNLSDQKREASRERDAR